MFDWFWEFLYSLSKSIFRLIDGFVSCANKLCGIETISVDGEETDFMSYVIRSESIANGFKIAAILGFIVLILFTVFRIIFVIAKEKPDMSPAQVCVKAFKILLSFLFVPAIMVTLIVVLNTFMRAMYAATLNGQKSIGTFLFGIFSKDAVTNEAQYQAILDSVDAYTDTDLVSEAIELSDFDFLLSWITGAVLIINLGNALLTFVDRAITIAVLFVLSPFSIASAILDDGTRFKLWREQVIVKFLTGYGMIIFLNIYCLLVGLVTPSNVVFFTNSFLNSLFKLLIILGGGYATIKSMALIGNLISAGAGSRDMMDAHVAGIVGGAGRIAGKIAKGGLKLGKWAYGKAKSSKSSDSSSSSDSGNNSSSGENSDSSNNQNTGEPMNRNPKFNQNFKIEDSLKNGENGSNGDSKNSGESSLENDNASGENNANNPDTSNTNNNKNELNKKREKDIKDALKTGSGDNNSQSSGSN